MCSGCSGDYAGDFEDCGESAADSGDGNRPAWTSGEPEADGNRPKGKGSFEAKPDVEWTSPPASLYPNAYGLSVARQRCFHPHPHKSGARWGSRCLPRSRGESGESGGEICEVMVSGTRIVEIRVITADSEEIKGFRQAEVAEVRAVRKPSKAASTKYYRTRASATENACGRAELPCYRRFAISAAGAFKRLFERRGWRAGKTLSQQGTRISG